MKRPVEVAEVFLQLLFHRTHTKRGVLFISIAEATERQRSNRDTRELIARGAMLRFRDVFEKKATEMAVS